jgi:HEAT repeat protein
VAYIGPACVLSRYGAMSLDLGGLDAADPVDRASALAALVAAGRASTATLLRALASTRPDTREMAAEGLAEIADPSAAEALASTLEDPEPRVRARAAQALASIGDPRALDALVRTVDDYPDDLHPPHTVATYVLIARGRDALPAIVPLLDAPNPLTRQRAYAVLRTLVSAMPEAGEWEPLWRSLGAYDPMEPDRAAREAAAAQWRQWIGTRCQSQGYSASSSRIGQSGRSSP